MILERIRRWAHAQPHATAIVWNETSLSYAQFCGAIAATQRFLGSHDLPRQGTAIVLVPALLDAWLSIIALRSLGLDTAAAASVRMAADLEFRDVACIVVGEGQEIDLQALAHHFADVVLIRVPTRLRSATAPDLPPGPPLQPGRHVLSTSGTTGHRKKVALDSATEALRNASWSRAFGFDRHTVFFGARFPLFTGVGYLKPSAVWYEGGAVMLDQRADVSRNLLAHPVTSLVLVPSMLQSLLAALPPADAPARGFALLVAGGFLPYGLAKAAVHRLTPDLGVYYASTEVATITLRSRFSSVDDLIWLEATGTRELQIVDENGRVLPAGQEGELRIRSTALDTQAYLDDEDASGKVFRDGFFHPGDMAIRREDGRIRILGRVVDVLNVRGRKYPVAPIEQRIQEFLRVEEVCVFAGMDDRGREEVAVAIRSQREIPEGELRAAAARLSAFERVRFRVLPEFPRDDAGLRKTQRRLLRQMLFAS